MRGTPKQRLPFCFRRTKNNSCRLILLAAMGIQVACGGGEDMADVPPDQEQLLFIINLSRLPVLEIRIHEEQTYASAENILKEPLEIDAQIMLTTRTGRYFTAIRNRLGIGDQRIAITTAEPVDLPGSGCTLVIFDESFRLLLDACYSYSYENTLLDSISYAGHLVYPVHVSGNNFGYPEVPSVTVLWSFEMYGSDQTTDYIAFVDEPGDSNFAPGEVLCSTTTRISNVSNIEGYDAFVRVQFQEEIIASSCGAEPSDWEQVMHLLEHSDYVMLWDPWSYDPVGPIPTYAFPYQLCAENAFGPEGPYCSVTCDLDGSTLVGTGCPDVGYFAQFW